MNRLGEGNVKRSPHSYAVVGNNSEDESIPLRVEHVTLGTAMSAWGAALHSVVATVSGSTAKRGNSDGIPGQDSEVR